MSHMSSYPSAISESLHVFSAGVAKKCRTYIAGNALEEVPTPTCRNLIVEFRGVVSSTPGAGHCDLLLVH